MKSHNVALFKYAFPWKKAWENHLLKRIIETYSSKHHKHEYDRVEFRKSKMVKTTNTFGLNFLTELLENEPRT
jgi:hypothetical protein